MSPVLDYIWRPAEYGNVSLYDWIRLSEKHRVPQSRKVKKSKQNVQVEVDCDSEFENDYFIDKEVSKSDTEADKDIDEYQTTVPKMFGGAHLLAEEEEESESENEPIACATKVKKEVKNKNPIELGKEEEEEKTYGRGGETGRRCGGRGRRRTPSRWTVLPRARGDEPEALSALPGGAGSCSSASSRSMRIRLRGWLYCTANRPGGRHHISGHGAVSRP